MANSYGEEVAVHYTVQLTINKFVVTTTKPSNSSQQRLQPHIEEVELADVSIRTLTLEDAIKKGTAHLHLLMPEEVDGGSPQLEP
jgi:hypothetical protein